MQRLIGGRRQPHRSTIRRTCFVICLWAPLAAAGSPTAADYFARYDGDGDGRVSLAEYQTYLARGFAQMDRNSDGQISGDEWPRSGLPALTLQRHLANLANVFYRQDSDHNGYLDSTELLAPPR